MDVKNGWIRVCLWRQQKSSRFRNSWTWTPVFLNSKEKTHLSFSNVVDWGLKVWDSLAVAYSKSSLVLPLRRKRASTRLRAKHTTARPVKLGDSASFSQPPGVWGSPESSSVSRNGVTRTFILVTYTSYIIKIYIWLVVKMLVPGLGPNTSFPMGPAS